MIDITQAQPELIKGTAASIPLVLYGHTETGRFLTLGYRYIDQYHNLGSCQLINGIVTHWDYVELPKQPQVMQ